jgi:hypothetical protein
VLIGGSDIVRTLTERGLRWVVVSLAVALGANLVALGYFLAVTAGHALDVGTWTLVWALWETLLFASVLPGFLGFWRMRQGKREYDSKHETNMRWASVAFVLGAVSALVFFGTGLVLGFVYVPATTALGWTFRAARQIAPNLVVVFVGLFLLWTIWRLGTASSRWVAAGAFLSGFLALVLSVLTVMYPLPTGAWEMALVAVPVLSVGLWLVAYLLVAAHLRGITPRPSAGPATT